MHRYDAAREGVARTGEGNLPVIDEERPSVGATAPASIFTSVDLPEPFLPIRACTRPGSERYVTSSRAVVTP